MISIGAVYRGPELKGSQINKAVRNVSAIIDEIRGPLNEGSVPWVNAVFVVPGSLGGTGFRGLAYGSYSKKEKDIVVQISVPAEIANSDDPTPYIVEEIHGANAMAFEFFRGKNEEFPLADAETLVNKVKQRLWKPVVVGSS